MGTSKIRTVGCATGVVMAWLLGTGTARGQHHHHGHSHSHHHHGHHHHHHHHHGHVHVVPHVVHPHVHVVSQPLTPIVTAAAPVNVAPNFQGVGMVVANPRANSGAVSFTLDGQTYNLDPGYQVALKSRPSYAVAFGKGDGSSQSYALADGKTYNFSPSNGLWDMREVTVAAAQPAAVTATPANAAPVTPVTPSQPSAVQTASLRVNDDAPPAVARSHAKGNVVQVAVESAEIRNGPSILTTAPRGKTFKVLDVRDKWVMVDFGGSEYGWMNGRDLRLADQADEAPLAVRK